MDPRDSHTDDGAAAGAMVGPSIGSHADSAVVFDRRAIQGALAAGSLGLLLSIANVGVRAADDPAGVERGATVQRWQMHSGIGPAREQAKYLRLLTGYPADPGDCGDVPLGPLPEGRYSGEEAWRALIAPVCTLRPRPDAQSGDSQLFADMSNCKCAFGFPRLAPLESRHVVVTASTLPGGLALDGAQPSAVLVIGRKQIVESGAASVPDLLRYLAATAFSRGSGYRASGAQFAELRGLGSAYTLVLINGRRTFGTAAELASSAFDLSVIPISAVDHIEVLMDATSVSHGTDAIGGMINVVLSDRVEPTGALRYGTYQGGGAHAHASMSGGVRDEAGAVVLFVDAERQEELLGRERDRWNNQDYRRFGGYDYRSPVASPPNVYSIDGQNLPGLDTPFAAAELNTDTGTFDFLEGRENLTSLRAYQGIVPRGSRATVVAKATTSVGSIDLSTELLVIRRENEMQLFPSSVSGYTMGAQHPENPYGVPVKVDALLAGLPAQRFQVQTDSQRAVMALDSQRGRWGYRAFLIQANEQAKTRRLNVTNAAAIAQALYADDWREVLSLYSTMRRVAIPDRILIDMPVTHYAATATQLHLGLEGPVLQLPAGELTTDAGVEYRQERMGTARRDVTSSFAKVRTPLIHSAMKVPGIEELSVMAGVRRDNYSDIGAVTRKQFGLDWRMTDSIRWRASSSESFRPPSLAELYWPRVVVPSLVFDTRRAQTASVDLITGGNPRLRPTWGHSNSISVCVQATQGLELSAEYWQVKARGHIAALAPQSLLANEEVARPGYVVRAPPSAEEVEVGRPGKLLALDISRQNVGGASTQGVDVSIKATLNTALGEFTPAVSASLTQKFLYSDLPIEQAQMEDRVGVASEFGTIPAQRAVASLIFERDQWRASIHARVISSYRDRSSMTSAPMQRRVAGGAVWDVNVTRNIGRYVHLTLGAFNVTDREPPFAHVGGSLGFDASQGDLSGREIYAQLTATL